MRPIVGILVGMLMAIMPSGAPAQGLTYGSGACPNPSSDWRYTGVAAINRFEFNVLGFDDRSRKTWNGEPVTDDLMFRYLRQTAALGVIPVVLRPRPDTGCEEVIRLRRIMAGILDCGHACKEVAASDPPAKR